MCILLLLSIQINPADGVQGIIEITELKDLLAGAINKKLQLAIFNSCDGLGLANQLTELSLPYCIVMREMVEFSVPRELLKHFLAAFVKDRSLFASMNAARQQLQQKFEPGKSWLPVIVANPLSSYDARATHRQLCIQMDFLPFLCWCVFSRTRVFVSRLFIRYFFESEVGDLGADSTFDNTLQFCSSHLSRCTHAAIHIYPWYVLGLSLCQVSEFT